MTPGQRVAKVASKYIGVREVPDGSNKSPQINKWSSYWSMSGVPWCGTFASGVLREAGVTDVSHPSTYMICKRAAEKGWKTKPMVGSLIVWCGKHVGILVEELSPGVWRTIEGNTSNQVAYRTRSIKGATIVTSPEVAKQPTLGSGGRRYYLQDVAAKEKVYGGWRSKRYRDRMLKRLKAKYPNKLVRKIRYRGKYAVAVGDRRVYGPWNDLANRDKAQKVLEKRLGRRLRKYSRAAKKATAEALGQTQ